MCLSIFTLPEIRRCMSRLAIACTFSKTFVLHSEFPHNCWCPVSIRHTPDRRKVALITCRFYDKRKFVPVQFARQTLGTSTTIHFGRRSVHRLGKRLIQRVISENKKKHVRTLKTNNNNYEKLLYFSTGRRD